MFKLLVGAAIGAAAMWFLDPERGGDRRTQALGYARQGKEQAAQAGESVSQAVGSDEERAPAAERLNDPALQAKVESEIFRPEGAPKGEVSVNVEDGVVYLRGQLDDPGAIEALRDAAAKVDGVRRVESLLHGPGEPAPEKDESRSA
jgi:osmotically-inducible protein OsmY